MGYGETFRKKRPAEDEPVRPVAPSTNEAAMVRYATKTAIDILKQPRLPDTSENWITDGACKDEDPDLFFTQTPGSIMEIRAICLGCSVLDKCLTDSVKRGDYEGIRAGLKGSERQKKLKKTIAEYHPELSK